MDEQTTILVAYAIFIWLVVLHTFEEIASGISTLNMATLVLLTLDLPAGTFIGLFTTAIFGILQRGVHTVGYFREGRQARGLGAGFYSAIPLAIVGVITFYLLLQKIF